jgi:hypothetical protein
MEDMFAAADRFLLTHARLLERRLFATYFLGQSPGKVVDALRAYQNEDGGFGHALEPDTRCPASLPIYVEMALQALAGVGATDERMVKLSCDFLAGAAERAGTSGAVPLASPVIESFPRAAHWTEWTYTPALNPTAGLVGLLYQLGVEHHWRDEAEEWCWQAIEKQPPADAHTVMEVLIFLEHVPQRQRAEAAALVLAQRFPEIPDIHLDPYAPGYGLSPLQFAPMAGSRWRGLFTAAQVEADLDRFQASQEPDGGWPISWDPPGETSRFEWRGVVTLEALRTLSSYGRLDIAPLRNPSS